MYLSRLLLRIATSTHFPRETLRIICSIGNIITKKTVKPSIKHFGYLVAVDIYTY